MNDAPAPSILVVDDTVANLELIASMLGEQGFEVRPVTNGRLALQAVEHAPPDLILLDVNMPEMDGYAVCRALKQKAAARDVPVIFLTALNETSDKVKAFEAGGVDYVTKPFQFEEVLARVRAHVGLRRAQVDLAASYERLRSLEKLRDDLVHMVVHDMRSPLGVLLGRLELLRKRLGPALADDAAKQLVAASAAAAGLNRMANELLDVSRLEAGQLPLSRQSSDLAQVARDVAASLAALDRSRAIDVEAPERALANVDEVLVRRVLENLVSNGVKHTPAGSRLTIAVAPHAGGTRLSVQDQGPGVPAEARERIFEKFGTVEARQNRSYHSAGLGLAFCRLAVEAHGGRIGVEAPAGGGSRFWFELPA
jgi:signal transduction histidine kinase